MAKSPAVKPAHRTAEVAFEERKTEVTDLLRRVQQKMGTHEKAFKAGGSTNWGYVGDLAEWSDLLKRILGEEEE